MLTLPIGTGKIPASPSLARRRHVLLTSSSSHLPVHTLHSRDTQLRSQTYSYPNKQTVSHGLFHSGPHRTWQMDDTPIHAHMIRPEHGEPVHTLTFPWNRGLNTQTHKHVTDSWKRLRVKCWYATVLYPDFYTFYIGSHIRGLNISNPVDGKNKRCILCMDDHYGLVWKSINAASQHTDYITISFQSQSGRVQPK